VGYVDVSPDSWGTFQGLPVLKSAVDTLQAMGIQVIRQGGTVSQSFAWKDWRGPAWNRPSLGHVWGASLVSGWGMFEFIQMCMGAGIEPIVTLAYDLNSVDDWADLVEYVGGYLDSTLASLAKSARSLSFFSLKQVPVGQQQHDVGRAAHG
jgi:alpha-L-arabinofuranosidase